MSEFADAILRSPLGALIVADLENRTRVPEDRPRLDSTSESGVGKAVALVSSMSFHDFIGLVIDTAAYEMSPWSTSGPETVAAAYRHAPARAAIAEAIDARFGEMLDQPADLRSQQWWSVGGSPRVEALHNSWNLGFVYDDGQFPWGGLWTVTDPPEALHDNLVDGWELPDGERVRWHLPVRSDARVYEINRPEDWVRLVAAHPRRAAAGVEHWQLPGRGQQHLDLTELLALPGQHAARSTIRSRVVPDWPSVAKAYDGVHVTWAGFMSAEGYVSDIGEAGDVTLLRYWGSERTLWLADVFGEPELLPPPD